MSDSADQPANEPANEPASAAAPSPPPRDPPRGAMSAIFLIVLSDLLGFGVIIPLLPFYARKYAASDFSVGLLFTIFSLCQLVAAPILGVASDRFGRRPVLLLSQAGSVAGYVLLAFATWYRWEHAIAGLIAVYISRAIDGLSGGNISTAQAYVSDVTTSENRAKGMGMLGAAFGIGFSIGPAIGGVLGGWKPWLPALGAAAFSFFAMLQTWLRLPESRHHEPSEAELWLHPSRFRPILARPALVQILLVWFFSMMAFVMLETTFAIFLNDTFNFGPRQIGWFFAYVGVIIVVVQGRLIGMLTPRFGEWRLAITGPILVSAAMAMYVVVGFWPTVTLVLIAGLFNATGRSLQTPTLSSLTSKFSAADQQGTTFGVFHMLGSLARVIGPMIATGVYTRHHTAPFAVAGSITAGAAVWTVALRQRTSTATPGGFEMIQPGPASMTSAAAPLE